jgi:hypothetical protein
VTRAAAVTRAWMPITAAGDRAAGMSKDRAGCRPTLRWSLTVARAWRMLAQSVTFSSAHGWYRHLPDEILLAHLARSPVTHWLGFRARAEGMRPGGPPRDRSSGVLAAYA